MHWSAWKPCEEHECVIKNARGCVESRIRIQNFSVQFHLQRAVQGALIEVMNWDTFKIVSGSYWYKNFGLRRSLALKSVLPFMVHFSNCQMDFERVLCYIPVRVGLSDYHRIE